jgi:hypothetical protein
MIFFFNNNHIRGYFEALDIFSQMKWNFIFTLLDNDDILEICI